MNSNPESPLAAVLGAKVRCAVVQFTPRPRLLLFDAGGKLIGGRDCANIRDASLTLLLAKTDDNLNHAYAGEMTIVADVPAAEYSAIHWAAGRAKLKMNELYRRALRGEIARIVKAEIAKGRSVQQAVAEFLASQPD